MSLITDVCTSEKAVAITFDDGPNPIYTPQILEIFSEVGGKATFFMIGEQMKKNPEIVNKVANLGHEIGNHTFSHARLSQLKTTECLAEIEGNEKLIEELTGHKPVVFRPPFLDYNDDTISILKRKSYSVIGAQNIEAQDWEQPGVEHIVTKSKTVVKNGSILIFHDGYGDRSQTIEAVRIVVAELLSQNYQFITVSELLKLSK